MLCPYEALGVALCLNSAIQINLPYLVRHQVGFQLMQDV